MNVILQSLESGIEIIKNSNWDEMNFDNRKQIMIKLWSSISLKTFNTGLYNAITKIYYQHCYSLFSQTEDYHVFSLASKNDMIKIFTEIIKYYKLSAFH